MIRVTFDPYYIDDLQDYYRRNECIREQQYLSQEKLLHLAAFCVSRVANDIDDQGELKRIELKGEAALDVVRQLSLLCDDANSSDACIKPVTFVNGQAHNEASTQGRKTRTPIAPTRIENVIRQLRRLMKIAISTFD